MKNEAALKETWNTLKGPLDLKCPSCEIENGPIYMTRLEAYAYDCEYYHRGDTYYPKEALKNNVLVIEWDTADFVDGGDEFSFHCGKCGEELNDYFYELQENDRLEIHDG